jgi:predicted nuclease of predicted toxin-antitoxin system
MMRILIDECIDERFRNYLPGHDCQTARYAGLAGLSNGELLTAAETARFDVFLTADQGIEYQQNLTGRNIAIIILRAKSNRLGDLLSHVPACLAHIESIRPGQVMRIED